MDKRPPCPRLYDKYGVDKLTTPPFKQACVVRSPLNRTQLLLDLPKMFYVTTTCATLKCFNMEFRSAEHAYQWHFMKYIRMDEHALEILDAETPAKAKEIASRIPRYLHRDWHKIKLTVMREILISKADYCPMFKIVLIDSSDKDLIECTQDLFWVSGLSPRLTATTKQSYYPGSNMLGNILESVRRDLLQEVVLTSITDTDIHGFAPPPLLPLHVISIEETHVCDETHVSEETHVCDETHVSEETHVCDETHVSEETHVSDETHVADDSPGLLHVTSKLGIPIKPLPFEKLPSEPLQTESFHSDPHPSESPSSELITPKSQESELLPTVPPYTPSNIIGSNQKPNSDTESQKSIPPNNVFQKPDNHTLSNLPVSNRLQVTTKTLNQLKGARSLPRYFKTKIIPRKGLIQLRRIRKRIALTVIIHSNHARLFLTDSLSHPLSNSIHALCMYCVIIYMLNITVSSTNVS